MKRLICVSMVLLMLLALCGCSETNVSSSASVELSFVYGEQNVNIVLPDEEAQAVIRILDGKTYDPIWEGIPSCGFDKGISLKAGDRVYAIARDTCNALQDMGNLRYFSVSQEDMAYIHSLFEKYGGYFPCV